jgi:LAO/AO transport system kinase
MNVGRDMLDDLAERASSQAAGSVRAAARLMSIATDAPQLFMPWLASRPAASEPELVVGLTGAPGSGKSTLADRLVTRWREKSSDQKVGIIAVDPSSPFTGGALLGDRVRMMRHATDPSVFIRSLASRGHLGGLTVGVRGIVRVMGLIGCRRVVIETVGVGQSEVEIAQVADLVAVVLAPGQGDSIQMLKAGLMEAGDLFIVNKADRPGADTLHQQLLSMLSLRQPIGPAARCHGPELTIKGRPSVQVTQVPVFLTSANEATGIDAVLEHLQSCGDADAGRWKSRRRRGLWLELRDAIVARVAQRIRSRCGLNGVASATLASIVAGRSDIDQMANELMRLCISDGGLYEHA